MILSIIIPYFETYELTNQLLKQLEVQANNNVEVIVIDDGCNESRLDKFKFAKVIHQKNTGVAKARNRGIKEAKGKYIAFIDCDDMISNDYIDTLLKATERNDDVIVFDWQELNSKKIWHRPHNWAPWRAIYKKDFMPVFRTDRDYGEEDVDFTQEIDSKEHTESYIDKILYYYNENRQGSLYWKKTHVE